MDWIPAARIVDPDHDKRAPAGRPTDDLVRIATLHVDLDPVGIGEHLFDLSETDTTLRVVLAEMLAVGRVPDDLPIVHPFSMYQMDGQTGPYWDDFRTALLNSNLVH